MPGVIIYRYKNLYVSKQNTIKNGKILSECWIYNKKPYRKCFVGSACTYNVCKEICKHVARGTKSTNTHLNKFILILGGDTDV